MFLDRNNFRDVPAGSRAAGPVAASRCQVISINDGPSPLEFAEIGDIRTAGRTKHRRCSIDQRPRRAPKTPASVRPED